MFLCSDFEFYSVRKINSSLWISPNTGFILNMSWVKKQYYAVPKFYLQFSSVTQLCPILCNPMNCSTPGLPVHELPEFTQTHVL